MWVKVIGRQGRHYVGELANKPASANSGLCYGMRVHFDPKHVIDIT